MAHIKKLKFYGKPQYCNHEVSSVSVRLIYLILIFG